MYVIKVSVGGGGRREKGGAGRQDAICWSVSCLPALQSMDGGAAGLLDATIDLLL